MSDNSIVGQWKMTEQWFTEIVPVPVSPKYNFMMEFKADGTLSIADFTGAWQQNGEVVTFFLGRVNGAPTVNGSYIGQVENGALSGHALGLIKMGGKQIPVKGRWSGVRAEPSAQPMGSPLNITID